VRSINGANTVRLKNAGNKYYAFGMPSSATVSNLNSPNDKCRPSPDHPEIDSKWHASLNMARDRELISAPSSRPARCTTAVSIFLV
jgi:hypothetical protein